jgi:hypothetical protein
MGMGGGGADMLKGRKSFVRKLVIRRVRAMGRT